MVASLEAEPRSRAPTASVRVVRSSLSGRVTLHCVDTERNHPWPRSLPRIRGLRNVQPVWARSSAQGKDTGKQQGSTSSLQSGPGACLSLPLVVQKGVEAYQQGLSETLEPWAWVGSENSLGTC